MTILIYNEKTKLLASFLNLLAVSLFGVGVTTPVVATAYQTQLLPNPAAPGLALVFGLTAYLTHLGARAVLGRLVE